MSKQLSGNLPFAERLLLLDSQVMLAQSCNIRAVISKMAYGIPLSCVLLYTKLPLMQCKWGVAS